MSSSASRTSAAIAAGKAKSKAATATTTASSTNPSAAPSTAKRVSRADSTEKQANRKSSSTADDSTTKTPSVATKTRKEIGTKRKALPQSNITDQGAQNASNNGWPILRSSDVIGDLNSLAQLRFHTTPSAPAQSADPSSSYFVATPSPLLHAWATRCATLEQASEPLRQQASMIENLQKDMQQFLQLSNNYLQHAQHGASEHVHPSSSINLQ